MEAAALVFARDGYEGASVDAIAEEAGYTVGALYSNFSSKRELFDAVFERYSHRHVQVRDELRDDPDLGRVAKRLLKQDDEQRRSWLLWLDYMVSLERRGERDPSLAKIERRLRRDIISAMPSRLSTEDAATLATSLQALWRGWMLARAAEPRSASSDQFATAIGWLAAGAMASTRQGPGGPATS
jgi:AcrR family transcriptional regulator